MIAKRARIRLFLRWHGAAIAAGLCAILVGTTLLLTQKEAEPAPTVLPTAEPILSWATPSPSFKATAVPKATATPVTDWVWPVEGEVATPFADEQLVYDVTLNHWAVHLGLDILAPAGAPVLAAWDGRVTQITHDKLAGRSINLLHADGLTTQYRGMDTVDVALGDVLRAGDILGTVGKSSLAEAALGAHLHFQVEVNGVPCNPLAYLP